MVKGIDILLLHMLHKMKGERSVAGPYYILKGKKSGQAIQDASLFGYPQWFGLFSEWDRQEFEQEISRLLAADNIIRREGKYLLTPLGKAYLFDQIEAYQINSRGFRLTDFHVSIQEIDSFWNQFLLLSQVASHYANHSQHYHPIITDVRVQAKFKQFWHSVPSKEKLLLELRDSIQHAANRINDELLISLLIDSISGYQVNGRTIHQLGLSYHIPAALIRVFVQQAIGLLYISIQEAPFSSLKSFFLEQKKVMKLTNSAQATMHLLDQGYDLEQISTMRKLKMSTIEDHLIEIAIHVKELDITHFVSSDLCQQVLEVSHRLQTKKLSTLKEMLGDQLSYFQIRLALVREGDYESY